MVHYYDNLHLVFFYMDKQYRDVVNRLSSRCVTKDGACCISHRARDALKR